MARQIIPTTSSLPTSSTTNHSLYIKLTSRNYLTWKTQFQPLLYYHKLNGFIEGSTPTPPSTNATNPDNPNPAFVEWYEKDQLLLSWIFFSI